MNEKEQISNYEIVQIFSKSTKKEIKEFGLYLNSPFFGIQPFTIKIYDTLTKYHPNYTSEKLTLEKIFTESFKGKTYNKNMIVKGFSLLTNYYISYLTQLYAMRDNNYNFLIKIKALNATGNRELFKKFKYEIENFLDINKLDFSMMQMDYEINFIMKSHLMALKNPRATDEQTVKLIEKFIFYFLFNYTVHRFELETVTKLHNYKLENSVINAFNNSFDWEKFYELLAGVKYDNEFIKNLILKFGKIFGTKEEKILSDFIDFIFINKDKIDKFTFYSLFFISVVYCSRFVFEDEEREKFMMPYYKKYLSGENIWTGEKATMVFKDYLEFIKISFRLGEVKWAEEFYNKYSEKLYKTHKEDAGYYLQTQLLLHKKKYSEALATVNKIQNKIENILNEEVRRIKLFCYYYLGYMEDALALITSYKEYMKTTNVFPKGYTKNINDFLNIYREIIINRNDYKNKDWEFLLKKIDKQKGMRYRNFLREIIKELKKESK